LKLRVAVGCTPDSEWLTPASKRLERRGPERWHFYLGGKIDVSTNELPPKEATHMSRDVKYIGYPELVIADTMWPSGLCRVVVS
jgi:hypothetical protein